MTLWKQAFRSIWRGRRSYLACVVLMAVGIMIYIAFHLLFGNLTASMEGMYADQRFGDGFARVGSIPLGAAARLTSIPGIEQVDATITAEARVLRESSSRIITLRLSSFSPGAEGRLNNFLLVEGAMPGEGGVLLGEAFALAGNIAVGDPIELVLQGQRLTLEVAGLVQSPEYVYAIPDTAQLMPDNEIFGFGYLDQERLGALTGMGGMANALSFLLEEGVPFSRVKPSLEEALAPYSLLSLSPRKDQPSHAMLKQEVDSIGAMSTSVPMLFILMAVIILYIMMRRMIQQERVQIGTMKAFGLSNARVVAHYLAYGGVIGVAGGLMGLVLGLLMTDGLTTVYLAFFSLPSLRVPPDSGVILSGIGLSVIAGISGAFMGARSVLRLNPSEAMRPAAPPGVRGDLVGRLPFLRHILNSLGFMAVRNISRNRFRSGFVVIGVAFAFSLTAFISSFWEMFDIMLLDQFTKVERYNLKISLREPASYTPALEAAHALEGVRAAEGILELPAERRREHRTKSVPLIGIEADSTLYYIYDGDTGLTHPPPTDGIILSSSLAGTLGVGRGDLVTVKTPYTGDEEYRLPVVGVVGSSLGAAAYMELESLREALGLPAAASAVLLDCLAPEAIKESLMEADNVAAVTDQDEAKLVYENLISDYETLIYMMMLAGVVIAFAIITNTANISLSERKREYATMRVMGMHPAEIGRVVGFEYWTLTLLSFPLGILLTGWIKQAMAGMINNDIFSIPQHTAPASFLIAAALCMAAVMLSNLSARQKIARFDMVEVLKERE